LNGMMHMNKLIERFGKQRVLGGLALISATLDEKGQILHLNKNHNIIYGELEGEDTPRIQTVKKVFEKANFVSECSYNIMQAMWNKWVMISTAVGTTCLFRGSIGDVIHAGGCEYITTLFNECASVAEHNGFKLDEAVYTNTLANMTNPTNTLMASMLKDIEKGHDIENEAIIEDLLNHSHDSKKLHMLNLVYTHLKTYLVRKERERLL
ncbi:MAG: ketopantoate reductase C-terminal domain-containing protein, partial [Saezia sp.]